MALECDEIRDKIFAEYGVQAISVEPCLLELIVKLKLNATTTDAMRVETIQRVARFTKTNLRLAELGCEPLYFDAQSKKVSNQKKRKVELSEHKEEATVPSYVVMDPDSCTYMRDVNEDSFDIKRQVLWREIEKKVSEYVMSDEEWASCLEFKISVYEYMAIHGDYGFLGPLKLDKIAYLNLYEKLESSVLRKKKCGESHSTQYFQRKVMLLAKRWLRFPELIPSMENIYSTEVYFLRASKKAKRSLLSALHNDQKQQQ